MRFRDKIKPQRPVVTYEILPPREKDGTLNTYAEKNKLSIISNSY